MSFRTLALLTSIACLAFAASPSSDNIAWGETDHGVRMGIAFGRTAPEPEIRLVFQNVDRKECLLPLGSTSDKGPVYDVEFTVTSPGGRQSPVFNFNGPPGVQHSAKAIVVEIPRGQKHEIVLSLKKLIYLDSGKNRPVTDMLARHYSVHASVDTSGDARWTRTLSQWMGKVVSGELRQ